MKKNRYKPGTRRYFEVLLSQVREARMSKMYDIEKIWVVLASTPDFVFSDTINRFAVPLKPLEKLGVLGRFANKLLYVAEKWAVEHHVFYYQDLVKEIETFLSDDLFQNSFNYPSFCGLIDYDEIDNIDNEVPKVQLPDELKNFSGDNFVLRIEDLDRFIDTFSSRDTKYKRAYELLDQLDKQILSQVEKGIFEFECFISYKNYNADGDAVFLFSHFELDASDPDSKYNTLYVVYRYETTAV